MTNAKTEQQAAEEAFEQGFHDIPPPEKRAAMSPEKLAIELSQLQAGSPPYILLSHELNLRLAKEQAKATLNAGWLGAGATILAVFIAAALGYIAGTSQPKESNHGEGEKTSARPASQSNSNEGGPVKSAVALPTKVLEVPAVSGNAQKAAQSGNGKPKP